MCNLPLLQTSRDKAVVSNWVHSVMHTWFPFPSNGDYWHNIKDVVYWQLGFTIMNIAWWSFNDGKHLGKSQPNIKRGTISFTSPTAIKDGSLMGFPEGGVAKRMPRNLPLLFLEEISLAMGTDYNEWNEIQGPNFFQKGDIYKYIYFQQLPTFVCYLGLN